MAFIRKIQLESADSSEQTMSWIGIARTDSLEIRISTGGRKPRTQVVPIAKCKDGSTVEELHERSDKMRRTKNLRVVSDVDGDAVQTPPQPVEQRAQKKSPERNLITEWFEEDSSWF